MDILPPSMQKSFSEKNCKKPDVIESLKYVLLNAHGENEVLRKRNKQYEESEEILRETNKLLQQENIRLAEEHNKLKSAAKNMETMKRQLAKIKEENINLKSNLPDTEKLKAENQILRSSNDNVRKQLMDLTKASEQLMKSIQKDLNEKNDENKKLLKEIATLKDNQKWD